MPALVALPSLDEAWPSGAACPGRPWRGARLHGVVYGECTPEALEDELGRWLAERRVPEGGVLRERRVYRLGAWTVKFFPPPSVYGLLRSPRAARSADRHFMCLPVPSPRPLLAARASRSGASLLVREYLSGRMLHEVWGEDPRAVAELAPFLAEMMRHRVLHGDLHPSNLLWDGTHWILLDVDGVRHRLHRPRRVTLAMWGRLRERLEGEAELRALHGHCRELAGAAGGVLPAWEEIEARALVLRKRHGR